MRAQRIHFWFLGPLVLALLAMGIGKSQPAHAKTVEAELSFTSQREGLDSIFVSEALVAHRAWWERMTFDRAVVSENLVKSGFAYELWSNTDFPIPQTTPATRISEPEISISRALNYDDFTAFRFVLRPASAGKEFSPLPIDETVRIIYDRSPDQRLLGLVAVIALLALALLLQTVRRPPRFSQTFKKLLRTPTFIADDPLSASPVAYLWITILCASVFGLVVGMHTGGIQILYVVLKLPLLLLGTLLISFLTIAMVSSLIASQMTFRVISAFALHLLAQISMLLAAFSPILLYFILNGNVYRAIMVITLALAGFASLGGLFGLLSLLKKRLSTSLSSVLSALWFGLFAAVGLQLGWMMRPWVGLIHEIGGSIPLMRLYSGNVFEAIFKLLT